MKKRIQKIALLVLMFTASARADIGGIPGVVVGLGDLILGTNASGVRGEKTPEGLEKKVEQMEAIYCHENNLDFKNTYLRVGTSVTRLIGINSLIGSDIIRYGPCELIVTSFPKSEIPFNLKLEDISLSNQHEFIEFIANRTQNELKECDEKLAKVSQITSELFERIKTSTFTRSIPAGITPGKSEYLALFSAAMQDCITVTGSEAHCKSLGVYFSEVSRRLTANLYVDSSQWPRLEKELHDNVEAAINQAWVQCYADDRQTDPVVKTAIHSAKCDHFVDAVIDENSQSLLRKYKSAIGCH